MTTIQTMAIDPSRGDPRLRGIEVVRRPGDAEPLALIAGRLYRWDRVRFCLAPLESNWPTAFASARRASAEPTTRTCAEPLQLLERALAPRQLSFTCSAAS